MYGGSKRSVVLLVLLLNSINNGFSQSPCPEYFRYLWDEITGDMTGQIEIPSPPQNVALRLRISLSVATALPTKYVGQLELATSRREAVKAVRQGRPLVYRLHFPVRNPIPLLTEITFNGQRYCMGKRARGSIVTTIFLEHTLYPPGVMSLSDNRPIPDRGNYPNVPQSTGMVDPLPMPAPNPDFPGPGLGLDSEDEDEIFPDSPINRPTISPPYTQKPLLGPDISGFSERNCGRANDGGVNYLIANGERTLPGQWPWLAAIFLAKIEYEFQCAGNLITEKHIITAAHCKFHNDLDVPASAFIVSLGRYHLHEWRERGSQSFEVLDFRAHPEYRNRYSADADLAIIVLRKKVQYSQRIQPLCLWSTSAALESIVGRSGFVVGWGKDEKGKQHLNAPRMAVTPIVSQEDCLRSNLAFIPSTSNRTFCAGRRDGSGPCNGDSGAGLILLDPNTGRYHLRGIVSLSLLDKERRSCDLSQYIVYVDTAKFTNWIIAQINE